MLLLPGFGPPFIAERRALVPIALAAHLAGGLSALALGPWPLSQVAGIPFADAYRAVAWLCWAPNLVVAEWLVLRRRPDAVGIAA